VGRAPRSGPRLKAERKRKMAARSDRARKRKNHTGERVEGDVPAGAEGDDVANAAYSSNDEDIAGSDICIQYNTVRGYVSAINELWQTQTSQGLNSAPRPQGIAMKALKESIIRGQLAKSRAEFDDRGIGTIKDGYIAEQVTDLTYQVWRWTDNKYTSIPSLIGYSY